MKKLCAALFAGLLVLLTVFPAAATSASDLGECSTYDPNHLYECNCVLQEDQCPNGFEWESEGDGYIVYADTCLTCGGIGYQYTVWDSHDLHEELIDGKTCMVCSRCSKSYQVESGETTTPSEPPTEPEECVHEFTTSVVAPNCEEEGYTWYDCSLCDYSYQDDFTTKTEHAYEYVRTDEPTCTKPGVVLYSCRYCGLRPNLDTGDIPALGHNWITQTMTEQDDHSFLITSECERCHAIKTETKAPANVQAQNWLTSSIKGATSGFIDMYQTLAEGVEIGGVTLGTVVTGALILFVVVLIIVVLIKVVL